MEKQSQPQTDLNKDRFARRTCSTLALRLSKGKEGLLRCQRFRKTGRKFEPNYPADRWSNTRSNAERKRATFRQTFELVLEDASISHEIDA